MPLGDATVTVMLLGDRPLLTNHATGPLPYEVESARGDALRAPEPEDV